MERDMYKAVYQVLSCYMDTFPDPYKYSTWIVRLLVGTTVITECYLWDSSTYDHVWESDWWEGENFVRILAAYPVDLLELPPYPYDCRVSADVCGEEV
jgi:hypothetical protein